MKSGEAIKNFVLKRYDIANASICCSWHAD